LRKYTLEIQIFGKKKLAGDLEKRQSFVYII